MVDGFPLMVLLLKYGLWRHLKVTTVVTPQAQKRRMRLTKIKPFGGKRCLKSLSWVEPSFHDMSCATAWDPSVLTSKRLPCTASHDMRSSQSDMTKPEAACLCRAALMNSDDKVPCATWHVFSFQCFRHFSSFHHSYASHAVSAEVPRPQSRPSFESDVWGSYRHLGNCIFCSVPPLKVLSVLQGDISPRWATHVHVHLPTDHHNEACTDADLEIQRFGDASRWSPGTSEHVDTLEVPWVIPRSLEVTKVNANFRTQHLTRGSSFLFAKFPKKFLAKNLSRSL